VYLNSQQQRQSIVRYAIGRNQRRSISSTRDVHAVFPTPAPPRPRGARHRLRDRPTTDVLSLAHPIVPPLSRATTLARCYGNSTSAIIHRANPRLCLRGRKELERGEGPNASPQIFYRILRSVLQGSIDEVRDSSQKTCQRLLSEFWRY
jgi:hypothetical protein